MEGLVFLLGVIGNIISVLVFLSPVGYGGILELTVHLYAAEFSLWTYYGIITPGAYLVATVNAFGVIVELVYVALFITYAPPSKRDRTTILFGVVNVGFFGAALLVTYFLVDDVRINSVGFLSAALNIIMYASPLAAMKRVMTTKSVEYMPFLLTFFLFLNGGVWTFYALLQHDWFVGVPNGIGFVLGIIQLALYALYNNTPPSNSDPLLPLSDDQSSQ